MANFVFDKLNKSNSSLLVRDYVVRFIVPSIAWLIACFVCVGIMYFTILPLGAFLGNDMNYAFMSQRPSGDVLNLNWMIFIRAVSIISTVAIVRIMRMSKWRRGVADTLIGGVLCGMNAAVVMSSSGSLDFVILGYCTTLGALGGFIYWNCAGRPQPPY